MGGCVPPAQPFSRTLGVPLAAASSARQQIPDLSEYQGCQSPAGSFIYRVYEAGTGLQDASAVCHSKDASRFAWSGAYYFARPGNCVAQAQRAISIARSLPHRPNVLIVDAEVPLATGYVKCADATLHAGGFPYANYTSPGLAPTSGGPFQRPLWIADYGVLSPPACVAGVCGRVAWQYSDAEYCRGVYGDCSWDEGITRIGTGPTPAQIQARKRHVVLVATVHRLARWQAHWKCGRLPKSKRVERWCGGWERQKLAARHALGLHR